MGLPVEFTEKMKGLLKEEYNEFARSYEKERVLGLRYNPLKSSREEFLRRIPFHLEKIAWAKEGYYYGSGDRPGKHPYHEAGLYYIQEPSAMAVAELLDPGPGDKVLDLCAAPGGKTTQIAGRLEGVGFLLSNEIHPARAKILSQNVERMGIANAVVTNEDPARLTPRFAEFFDKIVVDAPCSGEGMFRKDENAGKEWSIDHVAMCAARQQAILKEAAAMLKPGGRLVYSTCTFSPEENEWTIEEFLDSHPDFYIEDLGEKPGLFPGRPEWSRTKRKDLFATYRIWPHRTEGEGHYLAALRKAGGAGQDADLRSGREKGIRTGKNNGICPGSYEGPRPEYIKDRTVLKDIRDMAAAVLKNPDPLTGRKEYIRFGDQVYLVPPEMPDMKGLKIVRPGLHIGTSKKNRLEPAHALAMYLHPEEAVLSYDRKADDLETVRYLMGEAVPVAWDHTTLLPGDKGWVLISADGYSLGFSKLSGGVLKNHYPKGLRWM